MNEAYCASKHAVVGPSKCTATTPGSRALNRPNIVCPEVMKFLSDTSPRSLDGKQADRQSDYALGGPDGR